MIPVLQHATLASIVALAMAALPALAEDKAKRREALYEIALDIDRDGRMDRALLVLVGPGRTDFNPLTAERYGLSEDESIDLYIYLAAGDEKLDLARKPAFLKAELIDPEQTPWVQPLESTAKGSLVVTSVYGWGARQSWGESITIVHRDGEFLVAGYGKGWEWSTEVHKPNGEWDVETAIGGCDINFLTGKSIMTNGLDDKGRRIKGTFKPLRLLDWPAWNRPKACEF